jgi:hypothetical protein
MSGKAHTKQLARLALGRRDVLRGAGVAAGVAAFGPWLPRTGR